MLEKVNNGPFKEHVANWGAIHDYIAEEEKKEFAISEFGSVHDYILERNCDNNHVQDDNCNLESLETFSHEVAESSKNENQEESCDQRVYNAIVIRAQLPFHVGRKAI